jgi:hypothetical protein
MKTVRIKKGKRFLDPFEVLNVVRSVKTFVIKPNSKNENEDESEETLHVTFFNLQSNNRHAYLVLIEPIAFTEPKDKIIKIKELDLEIRTETVPNPIIRYVVKNIPLDEDLMLFLLLDELNLLDYDLEETDDIIFFE